ncbi:MAG: LysM peptidoglycan-binding domain-containing protein [Cytophagaceae bacterium]|jgi:outer membrane protein OmpA-like peptidoglycan-associated protein/LysM repeat protein|nr:LysM peptidoglycan-binding domain-containing protein [Cytophagaceae bacterium]
MRKIIHIFCWLIACWIVVTAPVQAQNNTKVKASPYQTLGDQHFKVNAYYYAIAEYKKVLQTDPNNVHCNFYLGECYRELGKYVDAERHYASVIKNNGLTEFPVARYWYAMMLRDNNKYDQSLKEFTSFVNEFKAPNLRAEEYRESAKQAIEGLKFVEEELKKPQRDYNVKLLPVPLNSEQSDLDPVITPGNDSLLVITTTRKDAVGTQDKHAQQDHSDMLRFTKTGTGWEQYTPITEDHFDALNSKFTEKSGSFTADGSKFYFARCDMAVKVGQYETFNCGIYVVSKDAKGHWGVPVLLNENINPEGEWNSHPSISPDGKVLFFSSRRPGGLGGVDIWYSINTGNENWSAPINLGEGINSVFNDIYPKYYAEEKLLYFCSNGRPGFGGFDIFVASEEDNFESSRNLSLPFNSSRDDFSYMMGKQFGYFSSNRPGGLGNDDIYIFNKIAKPDAQIASIDKDSIPVDAKSIAIVGTIVNASDNTPAKNVEVALTDEGKNHLKTTTTNNEGEFRFDNLSASKSYQVVLVEKDAKVTQMIQYVVDTVYVLASSQESKTISFENIYFDFNSADLRPEAKLTLDELIAYARKNPGIQIELNANADAIGSAQYNKVLSAKRGNAAKEYLIANGVDPSRIVMTALGSERPLASNENEIGRQLNRRVELFVLGGPDYQTQTMTYVIEPQATLEAIAKRFNMTIEEIKEINALTTTSLVPFTPLRVRRNTGDGDIIAQSTMSATFSKDSKLNKKQFAGYMKKQAALDQSYALQNEEIVERNKVIAQKNQEIQQNIVLRQQQKITLNEGEALYKVNAHNTLFSIAKLYRMDVASLKALNGLSGDTIYIHQLIKVKTGIHAKTASEYQVKEGDTLESIAASFNITVDQLLEWNNPNLKEYTLQEGMFLYIMKVN